MPALSSHIVKVYIMICLQYLERVEDLANENTDLKVSHDHFVWAKTQRQAGECESLLQSDHVRGPVCADD